MPSSSLDASSIFRVDGLVAVVTGGGSGIGLVMARALAENGAAKVYILGRRMDVLEAAAAETRGLVPIGCDVTSKESLQAAVDRVAADSGHVDLLVANSGIFGPSSARWQPDLSVSELRDAMFVNGDMADVTNAFNVNVTGAFFTFLAFLELLHAGNEKKNKAVGPGNVNPVQSQVVFISSIASFSRHNAGAPVYGATKAALTHLTKHTASAVARHGIRANALAPGLFPSDMTTTMIGDRKPDQEGPDHAMFQPSLRFGTDEDMAGAILYLAARSGGFTNGCILVCDGGRLSAMSSTY